MLSTFTKKMLKTANDQRVFCVASCFEAMIIICLVSTFTRAHTLGLGPTVLTLRKSMLSKNWLRPQPRS